MQKKYEASYSRYVYRKPKTYWSSDEEVKGRLKKVDLSEETIDAGGLPIISDGKIAYIDAGDSHTIIEAISGMKKSICVFMVIIYILGKAGENMVITDPKGELYARLSGFLKSKGYKIPCLDFRTMDKDGYNILSYPARVYRSGDKNKGMLMLNDLVNVLAEKQRESCKDVFWPDTGAMWKNGTGHIMFESYPSLEKINICNWAEYDVYENMQILREFIPEIKANNTTMTQLKDVLTSAENTLRSILITASSFLAPFIQNDSLAQMLSHSTFDLEELCDDKTALFIITDDTTTTCDAIVGIIISQIQSFLVDRSYESKSGALEKRMNFVLDEFTSYPLPNIGKALATHRSRNLRYFLCLQSISALKHRYKDYEAILANCGNSLFLGSTEKELLEHVSEQCGKTNITYDGKERPLISTAELMSLRKSWEQKEGIFLSLSDSLRYCTSLPSIEAYGLEEYDVPSSKVEHPEVQYYGIVDLIRDINNGKAKMPFRVDEDILKKNDVEEIDKDELDEEFDYDLQKELEEKFNELFGPIDSDDEQ